jgi:tetratricopeptide (TPR) repeat protein
LRFATVQRMRGALDEALALDTRALELLAAHGHADRLKAALGLGETHLAAGRPAEAIARLAPALPLALHREDARLIADLRYALARALWDAALDPTRARLLATAARDSYADTLDSDDALAEVETWIANHPASEAQR